MKKRTIHVFPILLVFLLLLVGCRNSGQEPRAEWDQEAGILTVDGVRYRKDEALVSIGDGLHRWRYEQSVTEQIASAIFGDDPAKALPVCAEFMKLHQENPGEL